MKDEDKLIKPNTDFKFHIQKKDKKVEAEIEGSQVDLIQALVTIMAENDMIASCIIAASQYHQIKKSGNSSNTSVPDPEKGN